MTQAPGPGMFTREFIILSIVLACASAMMALFFQFHAYLMSLNIDPRWYGFLLGSDAITGIILQPLLSPYLNMRNAKKAVAAGICIMAAALVCYNFAMTTATIAFVRIMHGGGFVIAVAGMMTLFAGHIPPARSGEAIGIISIVRLVPYALVPPLVVCLAEGPRDFMSVVTVAAGLTALLVIPLAFVRSVPHGDPGFQKSVGFGGLAENLKDVPVAMLLVVNVLFYSSYTILFYFLRDFGSGRGIGNPGFFFTAATIAMIVIRLAGSRYLDRVNKARVCAVCMVMLAVSHLLVHLVHVEAELLALSIIFGVLWGVAIPLMMALLFDISEARFRGLNMNLALVMMQVGFFVGPLMGGIILARWGYETLFFFCGILNIAGAVLLGALPRGTRREECSMLNVQE
ncbi:MAG: MFS transporter [Syntrophorhabdaceae bacterium]|nr:MFS transporter [Syntrophorhabdaceae bacterium]